MSSSVELHVYGSIPNAFITKYWPQYWIWNDFKIELASPNIKALRNFLILKCEQDFQRWKNGVQQWKWVTNDEMDIYRYGILYICWFSMIRFLDNEINTKTMKIETNKELDEFIRCCKRKSTENTCRLYLYIEMKSISLTRDSFARDTFSCMYSE
jgi:hypothetical protein